MFVTPGQLTHVVDNILFAYRVFACEGPVKTGGEEKKENQN